MVCNRCGLLRWEEFGEGSGHCARWGQRRLPGGLGISRELESELVMNLPFLSPPVPFNETENGFHLPALTSALGMENVYFIPQ